MKSFDSVDRGILLNKLYIYGIMGLVHSWFKSYLTNRIQSTKVGDYIPDRLKCDIGVPQGSVIGPLLFVLYVNDLSNVSKLIKITLFADDTNLLYSHRNLKTMETVVNSELSNLNEWLTINKLNKLILALN